MSTLFGTMMSHKYAEAESSEHAHASYPFSNALIQNLNLQWRITTSGPPDPPHIVGVVDLGGSRYVNGIVFHICNPGAITVAELAYKLEWSDNNTDWTQYVAANLFTADEYVTMASFSQLSKRYHRLTVSGTTGQTLPIFGFVGLIWSESIAHAHDVPYQLSYIQGGSLTETITGDIVSRNTTQMVQRRFQRSYTVTTAELENITDMFTQSGGSQHMIALQEDAEPAILVRLNQRSVEAQMIAYGLYKVTLQFVEVPYILEGNTY